MDTKQLDTAKYFCFAPWLQKQEGKAIWKAEDSEVEIMVIWDKSLSRDITAAFAEYYREFEKRFLQCKSESERVLLIPLFVSLNGQARRNYGWSLPTEFVISLWDLPSLLTRCQQLSMMYHDGIGKLRLRSFAVGRFRRYLYLDDDNHSAGELNTAELRELNLVRLQKKENAVTEQERAAREARERRLEPWVNPDHEQFWPTRFSRLRGTGQARSDETVEQTGNRTRSDAEFSHLFCGLFSNELKGVVTHVTELSNAAKRLTKASQALENPEAPHIQTNGKSPNGETATTLESQNSEGEPAPETNPPEEDDAEESDADGDDSYRVDMPEAPDSEKGTVNSKTKTDAALKTLKMARRAFDSAVTAFEHTLPRAVGWDLKALLPGGTGRCTILVLDDDITAAEKFAGEVQLACYRWPNDDSPLRLSELLEPLQLPLPKDQRPMPSTLSAKLTEYARESATKNGTGESQSEWLRRFDAIALDLSFDTNRDREAAGFQLLPVLRKFLPDIPIVIHTVHGEMTHVQQAYSRGVSWFLNKNESWKLPANFVQMVQNPVWWREWRAMESLVQWEISADTELDEDRHRYLIWKCVKDMPGSVIRVQKMGGGIGGALTVRVSKRVGNLYGLAAPFVVKIDRRFQMLLERERYVRFIQPYLSNRAGRIDQPLIQGGDALGAIAYTYAGVSQGRTFGHQQLEVLPLEQLLKRNLPSHENILGLEVYAGLLDSLLADTLPRIHAVAPDQAQDDPDFPNSVFFEYEHPADAMLIRMPPEISFQFEDMLSDHFEKDGKSQKVNVHLDDLDKLKPESKILISVLDVEYEPQGGRIKAVARLGDGLLHRIDLEGVLAGFYAGHRYFRPGQPLLVTVPKTFQPLDMEKFQEHRGKHWEKLWRAEDSKGKTHSLLEGDDKERFFLIQVLQENDGQPIQGTTVARFSDWMGKRCGTLLRDARIGVIHGDLNLGNVIVEQALGEEPRPIRDDPWLIDFAWTRRDRIVWDFAEFEVDAFVKLPDWRFFRDKKEAMEPNAVVWPRVLGFSQALLNNYWNVPPFETAPARLGFIYGLLQKVRKAAAQSGIEDAEYLVARAFQFLIGHKIACGRWKKEPSNPDLQFRAVLTLKLAFDTARKIGYGK